MSKYKIATKTDKLRYQISKEVFGEIEDSDGIRDIPSWEIFEKCLEQHKRIQELETKLLLTEKALELACETLQDINFKLYNTETDFVKHFKAKAKEMMKNE